MRKVKPVVGVFSAFMFLTAPAAYPEGDFRPEAGAPYSANVIGAVQQRLLDRGYDLGSVDGINGPMTRAAIVQYKLAHAAAQETVTGEVDRWLLINLGLMIE